MLKKCWRILKEKMCWRMLKSVEECWKSVEPLPPIKTTKNDIFTSRLLKNCWRVLKNCWKRCWKVLKNVEECWRIVEGFWKSVEQYRSQKISFSATSGLTQSFHLLVLCRPRKSVLDAWTGSCELFFCYLLKTKKDTALMGVIGQWALPHIVS